MLIPASCRCAVCKCIRTWAAHCRMPLKWQDKDICKNSTHDAAVCRLHKALMTICVPLLTFEVPCDVGRMLHSKGHHFLKTVACTPITGLHQCMLLAMWCRSRKIHGQVQLTSKTRCQKWSLPQNSLQAARHPDCREDWYSRWLQLS